MGNDTARAPTYPAIWRSPVDVRENLWAMCGYVPSPSQRRAHLDQHRSKLVAGGERAGKSRWTAQEIHDWLWVSTKRDDEEQAEIWIVGPTYDLARGDFLHTLSLAVRSRVIEPGSQSVPKSGQCSFATRQGVRVVTRTSQDPETLAAIAPLGVAMVEAAQHSLEVYQRLRGRVSEKRGPLLLSGVFEGSIGWYPELWQRWQADGAGGRSFSLPTWENLAIFPGGRNDPEIKAIEAEVPDDVFSERYAAIPMPPRTLVFREFSHIDHVKPCLYKAGQPVQLWVDPGYAGAYAVLAVQIDRDTSPPTARIVGEVYERGVVSADIIERCREKPWWKDVKLVVMDIAGRQHHAGESHYEIWRRVAGLTPVGRSVPIADGIQRHRTFLRCPEDKAPRLLHDPSCRGTIKEYGLYRYNEIKENRPEREEPIDRDNHAMKAIAYGLVYNFGFATARSIYPPEIRVNVRKG